MRLTALVTLLGREPFGFTPAEVMAMTPAQAAALVADRDEAGKAMEAGADALGGRTERDVFFDALRGQKLKDYQIRRLWADRQARFNLPE